MQGRKKFIDDGMLGEIEKVLDSQIEEDQDGEDIIVEMLSKYTKKVDEENLEEVFDIARHTVDKGMYEMLEQYVREVQETKSKKKNPHGF